MTAVKTHWFTKLDLVQSFSSVAPLWWGGCVCVASLQEKSAIEHMPVTLKCVLFSVVPIWESSLAATTYFICVLVGLFQFFHLFSSSHIQFSPGSSQLMRLSTVLFIWQFFSLISAFQIGFSISLLSSSFTLLITFLICPVVCVFEHTYNHYLGSHSGISFNSFSLDVIAEGLMFKYWFILHVIFVIDVSICVAYLCHSMHWTIQW